MFPELSSPRFHLRQILPVDQEFIFKGLSDPRVIPFYGVQYGSLLATKAQMDFYENIWRDKTGCWWKVVDRDTHLPVGACGMNAYNLQHERAEIGYWLLPEFWQKGIMQEVLPAMIRHLFNNWKLHRIEAVIEVGNLASEKLSQKLGFMLDGILRESELKDGRRINLQVYSLLATDFFPA